ncbi:MAG TPA: M67 family metallopeptidase [Sphingomonas sp.]|nr:M67 family metallopeptidase [Sphingomonas sp.]
MTSVGISSAVLGELLAHAAAPEHEVCGLLFGTGERISATMRTRNVAQDPVRQFEIDPSALFKAMRQERAGGPALIGYYHSHPNGQAEPSGTDAAMAPRDGRLWLIVAQGEVRAWRATPVGLEEVRLLVAER